MPKPKLTPELERRLERDARAVANRIFSHYPAGHRYRAGDRKIRVGFTYIGPRTLESLPWIREAK